MEGKWKTVKTLNNDLQEALVKSDTEVQELIQELVSLQEKNKCLNEEKNKFLDLIVEADSLQLSLDHYKNAECMAEQERKELISISEEENRSLRNNINQLEQQAKKLKNDLTTTNLQLKEKDSLIQERELVIEEMAVTIRHYSSVKTALNSKIQELQSQLEESCQEAAKDDSEDDAPIRNSEDGGRTMYEMIQSRLETKLELAHLQREHQDHSWLRLLQNVLLQFLWSSFSVGILLILLYFFMRVHHTLYPDSPILDSCSNVYTQTIKAMRNFLHPFLKLGGHKMAPSSGKKI